MANNNNTTFEKSFGQKIFEDYELDNYMKYAGFIKSVNLEITRAKDRKDGKSDRGRQMKGKVTISNMKRDRETQIDVNCNELTSKGDKNDTFNIYKDVMDSKNLISNCPTKKIVKMGKEVQKVSDEEEKEVLVETTEYKEFLELENSEDYIISEDKKEVEVIDWENIYYLYIEGRSSNSFGAKLGVYNRKDDNTDKIISKPQLKTGYSKVSATLGNKEGEFYSEGVVTARIVKVKETNEEKEPHKAYIEFLDGFGNLQKLVVDIEDVDYVDEEDGSVDTVLKDDIAEHLTGFEGEWVMLGLEAIISFSKEKKKRKGVIGRAMTTTVTKSIEKISVIMVEEFKQVEGKTIPKEEELEELNKLYEQRMDNLREGLYESGQAKQENSKPSRGGMSRGGMAKLNKNKNKPVKEIENNDDEDEEGEDDLPF